MAAPRSSEYHQRNPNIIASAAAINRMPAQSKTIDSLKLRYVPHALDVRRPLPLDGLVEDMRIGNAETYFCTIWPAKGT